MEDKMKNIVVLKNLPSNLVEEAIVILKGNKKRIKSIKSLVSKNGTKVEDKSKDYIIKEAEMVISNYITNIENQKLSKSKKKNKNIEKKYKRLKIATIIMSIMLVVSLI